MTNPGLPRPIRRPDTDELAHRAEVCDKADAVIAQLDELIEGATGGPDGTDRRCA